MVKNLGHWLMCLGGTIALSSCAITPASNLSASNPECVQNYRAEVDYFPNKIRLTDAQGFTVTYHKHYKVVSVNRPWKDSKTQFQYVLVQCGTPIPQGFKPEQIVQVPVQSIVTLSTTHLVPLQRLGVLDRLVGISSFKDVTTPAVSEKIGQNKLTEVGNTSNLNVEKILELSPQLVTTFGTGNPQRDAHPKLLEAGLRVAIVAEYMESTPLGQAEWMKFLSLFFNKEAVAERSFAETRQRYQAIAAKTKSVKTKPTVFSGFDRWGTWYVPGGDSYVATFFRDAGANYLWANERTPGSVQLNFEQVYDRAAQAQYWIVNAHSIKTRSELLAADARYQGFAALQANNVFSPTAKLNAQGGNDYWQGGIANPDLILADLVKIFHPDLVPDHQFVYHRQLPQ
ncbi:ABC transporter substrate-binding protein [Leptothermofonsia sichuanensis E412]|uniref:ABC transporter substrate-binding protein n=1 Tax=Leptothermofonsia sichuanensis TaxID=2917832 RepID=UPI001CA73BA5|nr:ABC transporter substrate-binding protein [Leptothermofonsia sichuanensis]QZZ20579.1 ABC transporter substrate-binding protein [Leptothermofonsia sichuanensis E412]